MFRIFRSFNLSLILCSPLRSRCFLHPSLAPASFHLHSPAAPANKKTFAITVKYFGIESLQPESKPWYFYISGRLFLPHNITRSQPPLKGLTYVWIQNADAAWGVPFAWQLLKNANIFALMRKLLQYLPQGMYEASGMELQIISICPIPWIWGNGLVECYNEQLLRLKRMMQKTWPSSPPGWHVVLQSKTNAINAVQLECSLAECLYFYCCYISFLLLLALLFL